MTDEAHTFPALRVGVTGHRCHRLLQMDEPLLRQRVYDVLEWLIAHEGSAANLSLFGLDGVCGSVAVISALAEGADQLVAEEALRLGCALRCSLPFERDEYAADFAVPAAQEEYRALLAKAEGVVELAGSRETRASEEAAYANVGYHVVAHSDLLLAIWDGEEAHGIGGTAYVVASALQYGLAVIWINAHTPHRVLVLNQPGDGRPVATADWPGGDADLD